MPKRIAPLDIVLILLLLSASFFSYSFLKMPKGQTVKVWVDKKPYGEWNMTEKSRTLSINNAMDLEINGKGVAVIRSTCSRQICRHQGYIRHQGESIICVPNRIVVEITGEKDGKQDAIAK